jgi:uncharacterized protein YdgA (DUF945 family)
MLTNTEKNMKKITGLVVVLAAIVLGGYYGMGILTEKSLKKSLDMVNQSNGLFVDISDYKRGWFCSTAVLNWRLHVPERIVKNADNQSTTVPAQDFKMDMPLRVDHGPVMFSKNGVKFGLGYAYSDIQLPAQFVSQFKQIFTEDSNQPQLDVSLYVNYLARSKMIFSVPNFTLKSKQGLGVFKSEGIMSTVSVSAGLDEVNGDFNINGMTFDSEQVKATLGRITSEYSLYKTQFGLFLGEGSFSFPSLVVKQGAQTLFQVDNFEMSSDTGLDDGLVHSHFNSSLKKVMAMGKTYGPGNIEITLRNLDGETLGRINAQSDKIRNATGPERQAVMLSLLPEFPKLLSKGAEFEISDMRFTMPEGTIEGNVLIALPKGETNPMMIMQKMQAHGQLKMPIAFVKQMMIQMLNSHATVPGGATDSPAKVDVQLQNMTQSGLLVVNGKDYVIEFSLEQGQPMVNNHPFTPAMVKF